jgi:hypothetical protein
VAGFVQNTRQVPPVEDDGVDADEPSAVGLPAPHSSAQTFLLDPA